MGLLGKLAVAVAVAGVALQGLCLNRVYLDSATEALVGGGGGRMQAFVSVVGADGVKALELQSVPVPVPKYGQVLVKLAFAPVNPSDVYSALGDYKLPETDGDDPDAPRNLNGFEGVGVAVASGGGVIASAYAKLGVRLAFTVRAGGSWAEYALADPLEALPVPPSMETKAAAAPFVNPMTVIGFLETAKAHKHKALVHTAASSSLGLMLLRAAPAYGVSVVCVVRGEKNEQMLVAVGHPRELIVRSDAADFEQQLKAAVTKANARLAFDAVGGVMTKQVFDAMPDFSETYIYGQLSGDPPPKELVELTTPKKSFQNFHLAIWLKQGGLPRLAKAFYKLVQLLPNELSTDFKHVMPFRDPAALDMVRAYYKHQKGGKILLEF